MNNYFFYQPYYNLGFQFQRQNAKKELRNIYSQEIQNKKAKNREYLSIEHNTTSGNVSFRKSRRSDLSIHMELETYYIKMPNCVERYDVSYNNIF